MMTAVGNRSGKSKFAVLGMFVVTAMFVVPAAASAQWGSGYGYGGYGGYGGNSLYGYNGPVYHAPSMHYDRVYHATPHWTPWRGWHTHGHYDYVPHYTPGHYDFHHGNHIDANPYYHHP